MNITNCFLARSGQALSEHLQNVANLTAEFASEFNARDSGFALGALHDIGKYSSEFQARLENPKIHTDHATAGAKELKKLGAFGEILSYAAIGHHSGLPDTGSRLSGFLQRIEKNLADYENSEWRKSFALSPPEFSDGFAIQFFVRMMFSCLVDADRLDAGGNKVSDFSLRGLSDKIPVFPNESDIGQKRDEIRAACVAAAAGPRGMYTLTVPTGGGKTWSSLAFALKHAEKHSHKRIIYVIPYTSIIEQTASAFKKHLGEENVLEHHSNYAFEEKDSDELSRQELYAENWDAPIIVTTNVQFFESLFSHKPSKCRKLHNIAGSIIVLDEAQMLPLPFLEPCKRALQELADNYKCTIVLMSATQPPHFQNVTEIIPNSAALEEYFKRTKIVKLGRKSDEELLPQILKEPRVLVIVNTKSHAVKLAESLGGAYCLTTNMYPAHRSRILSEIKEKLNAGESVRVVSTQLIEAGVDIDFPVVFRAACGLDSLAQSAGRCNREGKLPELGRVYSFESPDENLRGHLQRTAAIGQSAADIADYFAKLLNVSDGDAKQIMQEFEHGLNFETVGESFRLIEDSGRQVIIPLEQEANELLEKLKFAENKKKILRKLRKYAVNVHFGIDLPTEIIADTAEVLCNVEKYYDEKNGLKTTMGAEAYFI